MKESIILKLVSESAPVIGESTDISLRDFITTVYNNFIAAVPSVIMAVILLVIGLLLSKLILHIMKKGMEKSYIDKTVSRFSYSLVKILLYIVIATIVLAVLGIPMSSIIAVIGTAGVTVGLALKDSLPNVAGGFTILMTMPFAIGDYILIEDVEGTVEIISIWYTKLLTSDNKTIFIPNGQITSAKVTNYTMQKTRRVDITFQISYNNDFRMAEMLIREVLEKHEKILKDSDITVRLFSQSESSLDIVCKAWVAKENYWDVYYDIMAQVKDAFDENGIEIPYRQLDVHVK
jgi:small conductance mechanosensitive channel